MSERDREMIAAVAALEDESDDSPAFSIPPPRRTYTAQASANTDSAAVVAAIAPQTRRFGWAR